MASIETFLQRVDALLVANENEFSSDSRGDMLAAAIERYSLDRPNKVTEDETGDGGKYYPVSGLTSWVEDFSHVLSIQYPAYAISADNIPLYLEPDDWDDRYYDGSTQYIFFPYHAPAATESFRVSYTAPYVEVAGAYNTPAQDFHAICYLTAGLCCRAIATKYSRTTDSTITADAVDHAGRADRFAARANEYISMYEKHMGISTAADGGIEPTAAGVFIDWNTDSGRRYLVHK